ncbi:DUF2341 domain-containing protein [Candidatus Pacearchaeota archaeon]|nr:DUF2341 domain-containing protein [Candidatus Pacearchaeota archaeon]
MGRTRLAKATAVELSRIIHEAKQRKDVLVRYLERLNKHHSEGKISYDRYVEILHKHTDGRTISEWIEHYEDYIRDFEKKLRKEKKTTLIKQLTLGLFFISLIFIILNLNLDITPKFVGFTIQEQEFSQNLDLTFEESAEYEWQLENLGELTSVKLSGIIEGEGKVKIYLDDLLIIDSSKIKKSKITGEVISDDESKPVESYSEEVNEALEEDSSPSQEPPPSETNEIIEEDSTENINQTEEEEEIIGTPSQNESYSETEEEVIEEDSSPSPDQGDILDRPSDELGEEESLPSETKKEKITTRTFKDSCEETCELNNLNKTSYTLKIEISNAKLKISDIKYTILGQIPAETSEENITEPTPKENVTEIPLPENVTERNITTSKTNVSTLQYKAIINKPTKWIKTIKRKESDQPNISIELPKEAENISVKTGDEVQQALDELEEFDETIEQTDRQNFLSGSITGNVALDIKQERSILTKLWNWLKSFTITGNVIGEQELQNDITETIDKKIIDLEEIINQTQTTEIAVEYYTGGPTAIEENISNGKRVIVSGDDELNYTEVLAFTEIEEKFEVGQESKIKVYWREENTYINFTAYDTDDNNKIDYVEWIAPHLSNQTFDIIIEIIKAEHLDKDKEFISDIYNETYQLDDTWSEEISNKQYVRITFEVPLDSSRDITIYPRITKGNPTIEVYEVNGTELIAEFTDIFSNEYNEVLLTNLNGTQDVFDLKIVGGSVEFDHIVDPDEWSDTDWPYRKQINVSNTYGEDLIEYQIELIIDTAALITAGKLNSNCSDLRFTNASGGLISHYVDENTRIDCNENDTLIWIQTDVLVNNANTSFYMYYGNSGASSTSNELDVFNYTTPTPVMVPVGTNNDDAIEVVSYADGNTIEMGGYSNTLSEGEVDTGVGSHSQNTLLNVTQPVAAISDSTGDALVPLSFAGTLFLQYGDRAAGTTTYAAYSFEDNNKVAVHTGGWTEASSVIVNKGSVGTLTTTTSDAFMINSTYPVVIFRQEGGNDNMVFYPAQTEYYGWGGRRIYMTALEADTGITCYDSQNTMPVSINIGAGGQGSYTSWGRDSAGEAAFCNSTKIFGVNQEADADGNEQTEFINEKELDRIHFLPQATGTSTDFYVSVIAPTPSTNCTVTRSGAFVTDAVSAAYTFPNPNLISFTSGLQAGDKIDCSAPVTIAYDDVDDAGDEHNLFGMKANRRFVYPTPTYTIAAEEEPPAEDTTYPQFSNYWDNNATLEESGTGLFNVTVLNTNGTVLLEINGTNITATNYAGDNYNASHAFTTNDTYPYKWHSWGNGTDENYNISVTRSYTVNGTVPDTTYPSVTIISPTAQNYATISIIFNITATDETGMDTCLYSLDAGATNTTMGNSSATSFNATNSSMAQGLHTVNFYCNDTSNNINDTENVTFLIDSIYPSWENNKTNLTTTTTQGSSIYFNMTLNETNPANYTFSWYNGTAWENTTGSYTDGEEVEVIKTININGGQINWTWYFNDTSGNSNQTDVWSMTLVTVDTTPPQIQFEDPTRADGNTTADTSIEINVSITESNLGEVVYNWNGTNFTLMNNNLVLFMNFDNVSALGENDTLVVDASAYENNGIVNGAVVNTTGKYNGCYSFNENDAINVGSDSSLDITNEITISVWINSLSQNQVAGNVKSYAKIDSTDLAGELEASDHLGVGVANIGDLDDDGIVDIVITANLDDDGGDKNGAAYIVFMNIDGTVKDYQKISETYGGFTGDLAGGRAGYGVAGIGDLDEDGVEDIAVGAFADTSLTGAVWVLFLNTNGTVKSYNKIDDASVGGELDVGDIFGGGVIYLGDLDGDGVGDIAVGTLKDHDGGSDRGAVYILFMDTDGTVKDYQKISDTRGNFTGGLTDLDEFGSGGNSIGDLNNDGVEDIAIGARKADDGGASAGEVWVLFMDTDGTVKSEAKINDTSVGGGLDAGDQFGNRVGGIGDLDGDGIEDIIVGASFGDDVKDDAGEIWVLFLDTDGSVKSFSKINDTSMGGGLDTGGLFGTSVANIGDLDGDGVTDFIAGAMKDDTGFTQAGAAWIVFLEDGFASILNKQNAYEIRANETAVKGMTNGSSIIAQINAGWNHVVLTSNSTNKSLYVNGVLSSTGPSGAIASNTYDLLIGNDYNGSIDELMIYNTSLNSAEAYQLYISNLKKYDTDKWTLYVNQSKNATTGLENGKYTYQTFVADTSSNWNQTEERTVTIGDGAAGDTAPQITSVFNDSMTDVSSGPNEGPSPTYVIINFTAYDANGASDLNDSTARINFTRTGETTRENLSCSRYATGGNYANYTCNVTMWWFDGAGIWNITAHIKDNQSNSATNASQTFSVGSRTAFVMGPSSLTWAGLSPGATNQTSNNDPLTLNNTGNDIITASNIEINATNLLGEENSSYGLWAGNFSVSYTDAGACAGTAMSSSEYTNITAANLTIGNYTVGDGTAQEELYFCIKVIGSELTDQAYSTSGQGAWTIRILLVALTTRRRKKTKHKNQTELFIPSTIFTKELGALEAISKYMKENLEMSYHEIGELLERDERTIWTSYNKAVEKQKAKLKVKDTEFFLPISIFSDKLTILEAVIVYLKQKGLRYAEIAELVDRDQRNVWATYSKAKTKLEEKEITKVVEIKLEIKIPQTIFSKQLGALEAISKYMKENLEMSYHEIGELLKRDERTIWTSYNKAIEKQKAKIKIKDVEVFLPISIFNKELTVLEAVVVYLKQAGLKYSKIAELVDRDQRNVWATYSKAKEKAIT